MSQSEFDFHFFTNTGCRYFPCHEGIPSDQFNCMHCYCPLYFVDDCGGKPKYTDSGIRDCSECTIVHEKQGWTFVRDRINEIIGNKVKFSEVSKND